MTAVVDAVPATVPAARPTRPRLVLTGTALGVGACFMGFASLMGIYLAARADALTAGQDWLPAAANIPLTPATMGLGTFLLSAVTMQWSVYAIGENDRQHSIMALLVTILFGVCTINATLFLYTRMDLGVADSAAGVLIYVISGAHIAMTVVGLVFIALMTFRTVGGEYSGRDREGIVAASLFWYATIAVYAVIWYAIYVVK